MDKPNCLVESNKYSKRFPNSISSWDALSYKLHRNEYPVHMLPARTLVNRAWSCFIFSRPPLNTKIFSLLLHIYRHLQTSQSKHYYQTRLSLLFHQRCCFCPRWSNDWWNQNQESNCLVHLEPISHPSRTARIFLQKNIIILTFAQAVCEATFSKHAS